jgi:hypothetical protein
MVAGHRLGRGARLLLGGALLLAAPAAARAQTVLGYQLGVTQSVGGTFGDNAQALITPGGADPDGGAAARVQQLQGIQLNTGVTGNLTLDLVGRSWTQGLVLGTAVTQIVPTAVPDDLPAVLQQRTTTLAANATYLARLTRPRWSLLLGGNYAFGLNGRLQSGADGTAGGVGGCRSRTSPPSSGGRSSSEMIRRMEARISSIVGSR